MSGMGPLLAPSESLDGIASQECSALKLSHPTKLPVKRHRGEPGHTGTAFVLYGTVLYGQIANILESLRPNPKFRARTPRTLSDTSVLLF